MRQATQHKGYEQFPRGISYLNIWLDRMIQLFVMALGHNVSQNPGKAKLSVAFLERAEKSHFSLSLQCFINWVFNSYRVNEWTNRWLLPCPSHPHIQYWAFNIYSIDDHFHQWAISNFETLKHKDVSSVVISQWRLFVQVECANYSLCIFDIYLFCKRDYF